MKLKIDIARIPYTEPFLDNISQIGIQVTEREDADLHVKLAHEITSEDLSSGKSFIVLEKNDGARILKREILKHPAVVRYVKQYKYAALDWNNVASVDQRAFTTFLTDNRAKSPLQINDDDLKKVFLGWNFLNYTRMRDLLESDPDSLKNDRKIDVFFAGKTTYGDGTHASGNLISAHRKTCIDTLRSIKGLRIFVRQGKPLNHHDYNKALHASKIVVSPWGWGEACYRDYEALLAGCILIKPMTSFVESYCDIFSHQSNIWTKADFSDLEEKILQALDNYQNGSARQQERRSALIKKIDYLPTLLGTMFQL